MQAFKAASMLGLDGLSIGTLAKQVGMSKSGLFAHFRSKENLQLEVLQWITEMFTQDVIVPALKVPRGEPRLRALLENWMNWHESKKVPGGCVIISAASEFDDQPGHVKDFLQASHTRLVETLARVFRGGIEEGHFRADIDPEQFAFELYSLILGFHHYTRLLGDPNAKDRLKAAYERKILSAKA
ncbi:MAG: TetR/AcrR family transcriptional regulator [Bdellovibrionales bacterium]|nr:TetR/AcrR family transcriptional regulator [Bdellovibrionales bacterium]